MAERSAPAMKEDTMPTTRLPGAVATDHTLEYDATEIIAFPPTRSSASTLGAITPSGSGSPYAANLVEGGSGDDEGLFGTNGEDHIIGYAGNDYLYGLAGRDILDGGLGADVMAGGTGDDVYYVIDSLDVIWEWGDEGIDTVISTADHTLASGVERLVLTGGADPATQGTGNELDNDLIGNWGGNRLYGLGGKDELYGEGGDDFLYGGDGNDYLDGGQGADQMVGGLGNDWYKVDHVGDVVWEWGDGIDSVDARIDYTLPEGFEELVTGAGVNGTGNSLDNLISGRNGNEVLRGLGGNDDIRGWDGEDSLIGGTGQDTLRGGKGSDTFAWAFTSETGVTIETMDVITDFTFDGTQYDRIDLNVIDANVYADGNQAFVFIGQAAFTGAPGEINYIHSGGNTIIQLQTGVDSDIEGGIVLQGLHTPEVSWFNL
jgi:Ca2+-binding RTX toxin-like protein